MQTTLEKEKEKEREIERKRNWEREKLRGREEMVRGVRVSRVQVRQRRHLHTYWHLRPINAHLSANPVLKSKYCSALLQIPSFAFIPTRTFTRKSLKLFVMNQLHEKAQNLCERDDKQRK